LRWLLWRMTTVATGRATEVRELAPTHCPNGQQLRTPNVAVAHLPCSCAGRGGHRTHTCLTCGLTHYEPPHTNHRVSAGQVRGR
jgi:hypothetical protein